MLSFPNAKINIGLQIIRKREDGFHELKTVFYPVKKLFDVLEILPSTTTQFSSTGSDLLIADENNLVLKAYRLLQQDFTLPEIKIHLHKVIPHGAGLGGGSADAAFALSGINKLFNLSISYKRLAEIAANLGSDCSYFIYNTPMIGSGRGEILTPLDLDLSEYFIAIVKPSTYVSTAKAYSLITPKVPKNSIEELLRLPISDWKDNLINDFEGPIVAAFPELNGTKEKLYNSGAIYASMSGSGSSFFGIFKEQLDLDFEEVYWS
jgi:4-diphosphocytidyl-2-C-methyl-D-erythritol kinase